MSLINENNVIILIIDIQEKLLNACFNKEQLIKKAEIIAKSTHILGLPIIITEQYPKGLGHTIENIKQIIKDVSCYFEKTDFSAIQTESIYNNLKKYNKKQVIIFGIETHICVLQTALELIYAGYEVFLVTDASGSRNDSEHIAGINRIKSAGGNIITTEIALFELLRSSKHTKFKEIQNLIK